MALTDNGTSGNFVATMPMQPMYGGYGGGYGGGLFGGNGNDWMGILFLIALLNGGFGGWGMGMGGMMWPMMMGGMGAGCGIDYLYPWLNNSEHISDGFRDQQLSSQISGLRSDVAGGFSDVQLGIAGLGRQICETGNSVTGAVRDGFYGAEVAAQGRHNSLTGQLYQGEINALNRSFAEQTANAQGFNAVNAGIADTRYTIATEACATRTTDTQNTNAIITALTAGVQSIKDQLCQDKIDAKNDEIAQLRQEVLYARGQASQVDQTARILAGQAAEIDGVYNRLKNCPVNTVPVYGNQPIFTCPQNANCGCGNNGFVG